MLEYNTLAVLFSSDVDVSTSAWMWVFLTSLTGQAPGFTQSSTAEGSCTLHTCQGSDTLVTFYLSETRPNLQLVCKKYG